MPEIVFKGKEYVYNHHLTVPYRPLVPDAVKGIGPADLASNLVIHGDNLHALKALLPRYAGQVDLVFIDPPYNTGNEGWTYNDNVNSPIMKEWLASNPVDGEDMLRHDKWLCMMWPRLVRALLDLAPNAWLAWEWVEQVLSRLLKSWDEAAIGASHASLIERLRVDLERQRDSLAQEVFDRLVSDGHIEFRLRADRTDYELPKEWLLELSAKPKKLTRRDDLSDIEKSLLAPAVASGENEFEAVFAGYLDEQPALRWWHRNVARTQYGLQGWKRHKLYPDFVFGFMSEGNTSRIVLLETKGSHLGGNEDTTYKQALLQALTQAFCDERFRSAGELALEEGGLTELQCDLVFDQSWEASMDQRYFAQLAMK